MCWPKLLGRQRKGDKETLLRHIVPVNADSFNSTMGRKRLTALLIWETALHCLGHNQRHNKILPATLKRTRFFDEVAADKLSKHKQEDHAINFASTNTHLFGLWYKLSTNELVAFWD